MKMNWMGTHHPFPIYVMGFGRIKCRSTRELVNRAWAAALVAGVWLVFVFSSQGAAMVGTDGWKYVQSFQLGSTGLVRISLPLASLTAGRERQEDLRLLDSDGREVPILLDRPNVRPSRQVAVLRMTPRIERDRTVLEIETGTVELVSGVMLATPAPEFFKAVMVEGSSDGQRWQRLVEGRPVFRQRNGAESLLIEWAPASWKFLRASIEDRRSEPVPFTGAFLRMDAGPAVPSEPLAIETVNRTEEAGESRLLLRAAGSHVVLAGLRVETPEPMFMRAVTLSYSRLVEGELQPFVFARDTLYRTEAVNAGGPVSSRETVAAEVELPSSEIVLRVRNDDNAPLKISGISATRRPLYMVFHAATPGRYSILSGNSECERPAYELASMSARLKDVALVAIREEAMTTNAAYRPRDPLAAIPGEGASLDVSAWRYRKSIRAESAGWLQLELDAAVLAHSSSSQSDLRLINAAGQQVPYILERSVATRKVLVPVENVPDRERPGLTRWRLQLPEAGLPIVQVSAQSSVAFFDRVVDLVEEIPGENRKPARRTIGSANWHRRNDRGQTPLVVTVNTRPQTGTLWLEVQNSDNAPLPLQQFEVSYPVVRLLFKAADPGRVRLYYGFESAAAPRYDLSSVASRFVDLPRIVAELGPEEKLTAEQMGSATLNSRAGRIILWSVLGVVTVTLLVIIARLLPAQPPESGSKETKP